MQGFEDDGGDGFLVWGGWGGADAVAWDFGDEEGGVRLQCWDELDDIVRWCGSQVPDHGYLHDATLCAMSVMRRLTWDFTTYM